MTEEMLQKRLKALESNFDQALAQVNALDGAIREIKYWIEVIKKSDSDRNNGLVSLNK